MEDWINKLQELYFAENGTEDGDNIYESREERRRARSRERYRKKHPPYIPESHEDEEYRDVVDNPNYEVSNYGNVRKKDDGRYLKGSIKGNGYRIVSITGEDGKNRQRPVHRLEASAFLGDYGSQGLQVNHKDGIKTNNQLENLEWCTASENIQHAHDTGLIKYTEDTARKHRDVSRRLYPPVRCIENGKVYPDAAVAAKDLGCDRKEIRKVTRGIYNSHKGFHFENADWSEINVRD